MKRFTSLLSSKNKGTSRADVQDFSNAPPDSPEASAMQATRLFCESGSMSNGGEEVLHLPVIVEAAESSPPAAAAAALQIRKFLGRDWAHKAYVQYNAIMLVRILSDNPGPTFTRNFDKTFVSTVKELLRNSRDQSTQQILRETLDSLEVNKQHDEGSKALLQMWRKEKGQQASLSSRGSQALPTGPQWQQLPGQSQNQTVYNGGQTLPRGPQAEFARTTSRHTLPPPHELASRIEEARNTAKILLQLIQSTPPEEVLQNPLCREFDERCQSAQRSMQTYINCDSPAPDHDTMQTLIETNEQLSLAGSRYQRAVLAARRTTGATPSPAPEAQAGTGYFPSQQPAGQRDNLMPPPRSAQPQANGFGFQQPPTSPAEKYVPPTGPAPSTITGSYVQPQAQPPVEQQVAPSQPDKTPSNPFLDPAEHDRNPAPTVVEATDYATSPRQPASHLKQPSQAFSIDSEPTYAPCAPAQIRRNTTDLENAYSTSGTPVSQPSPSLSRSRPESASTGVVSPGSPKRGGAGSGQWQSSGVTPSYMKRESGASNGLKTQGVGEEGGVPEIDSHSDVGRKEVPPTSGSPAASPVVSAARHSPRVDVAGTGGLRGA